MNEEIIIDDVGPHDYKMYSTSTDSNVGYILSNAWVTTYDSKVNNRMELISEIIEGLKSYMPYLHYDLRKKINEVSKVFPSIKEKEITIDGIDDDLFKIK